MIITNRFFIIGNAPAVELRTASGVESVLINGPGVYIGGVNVNASNGFKLDSTITPIPLKNGDKLYAFATSTALLTLFIST